MQPQQYHKEAIDVMGWIAWIDIRDRMEELKSGVEFFIVVGRESLDWYLDVLIEFENGIRFEARGFADTIYHEEIRIRCNRTRNQKRKAAFLE